ncbi:MAG: hypothetical protein K5989_11540 [Lachnospiraceae bacterium]|nr:hypothetical protein [Lachnospiraceae bacterium]
MKRRILIWIALTSLLLASCGEYNPSGQASGTAVTSANEAETSDRSLDEEEEEEVLLNIGQESADAIIQEKLAPTGCTGYYNEIYTVNGEDYYTYTVADSNEDEIDQMLAVNTVSGEVFVFDIDNETIADYSTFAFYDAERDEDVAWEGIFTQGDRELLLEPMDSHSFEFTITKGGKSELVGAAEASADEKRQAAYDDGKISLVFEMDKDSLKIMDKGSGKSGYAGTYKKKS